MKSFFFLCFLLLTPFFNYAQSLRESILSADYVFAGYLASKTIDNDLDYNFSRDSIEIKKVIKGEYSNPCIIIDAISFIYELEVEEERRTHLFFVKKAGNSHYLFNIFPIKLKQSVEEMLKIGEIKEPRERFLATVEWTIGVLEKSTPLEYVDYNDLKENSTFISYYKSKGVIGSMDSVLTSQQKERVLKKLCKLKHWGWEECDFADLIYKDYPFDIEQHMIKIAKEYFKNTRYPNIYDIRNILEVLVKGEKSKRFETLLKKAESDDYEHKLIQEVIDELGERLKQ